MDDSMVGAAGRSSEAGRRALLSREAGYSVAQKCLELQAAAERAHPSLRQGDTVVLHPDAWPWYVGAIGEIEVGGVLSTLGPEWTVRHAVPIGSGTADVDHLVVGPSGVFALNTKRHADAKIWIGDHVLRVNNQNQHHLSRARGEAANASQRLGRRVGFAVPVTSVLVFVRPESLKDGRQGDRTHPHVVTAQQLVPWLKRQEHSPLSSQQLASVRHAADDPMTWHVDPSAADTFRVMERFRRLVAVVGAPPPPPIITEQGFTYPQMTQQSPRVASRGPSSRPRTRRPSKREAARRARRTEDLIKLALLGIAALTFPVWVPALGALLTAAITP